MDQAEIEKRARALEGTPEGRRLEAISKGLAMALGPILADITKRIDVLESRPTLQYSGVWVEGKSYVSGSFVTHAGSMWHANRATMQRPGEGATDWTLAVKQGRPGRDPSR